MLIIPTTLVCLLFSTAAIPTLLFNFKKLFFVVVSVYFLMILDHSVILIIKFLMLIILLYFCMSLARSLSMTLKLGNLGNSNF